MAGAEAVRAARRRLGRQLAGWRRAAGYTQHTLAPLTLYGRSTIANVETGGQHVPRQFWVRCDEILGAHGELLAAFDALDAIERHAGHDITPALPRQHGSAGAVPTERSPFTVDPASPTDAGRARGGGSDSPDPVNPDISRLTGVLLRAAAAQDSQHHRDLSELAAAATAARRAYQHAHYRQAIDLVAGLIADLDHPMHADTATGRERLLAVAAIAYQTASGLLLKFDAPALAAVAGDRSMTAATAGDNPLAVAASSRAVVHALAASGHPGEAVATAVAAVDRLDHAADASTECLSVRGALLLRAALAAAGREDRNTTGQLLDEAADTAQRLGRDTNAMTTAFGPTNVLLHRVAAAVRLGDAGTAVHLAGTINLDRVALPERRAMLHLEVAQAYAQWGKYDRALEAIRTADHAAPQEVRTRPVVHRMLDDLLRASPPHLLPRVRRYAETVGLPL